MIGAAQALYAYYSSFGLPAYNEMSVPDDATLPYITYNLQQGDFCDPVTHYVQVWDRSYSYSYVAAIADMIVADIGRGKMLPYSGGYVCIRPSTPLIQLLAEEAEGGPTERRAYINLQLNIYGT